MTNDQQYCSLYIALLVGDGFVRVHAMPITFVSFNHLFVSFFVSLWEGLKFELIAIQKLHVTEK